MRWCDTQASITALHSSPRLWTPWHVASSHRTLNAARAAAWARQVAWVHGDANGAGARALVHLQLRVYYGCEVATALRHAHTTPHDRFLEYTDV